MSVSSGGSTIRLYHHGEMETVVVSHDYYE